MTETKKNESMQENQHIELSKVNNELTEEKQNSLDKGIKNIVGFVAKATKQPDPET